MSFVRAASLELDLTLFEMDLVWLFMRARLAISLVNSALASSRQPENATYILSSAAPAAKLLTCTAAFPWQLVAIALRSENERAIERPDQSNWVASLRCCDTARVVVGDNDEPINSALLSATDGSSDIGRTIVHVTKFLEPQIHAEQGRLAIMVQVVNTFVLLFFSIFFFLFSILL